MTEFGGPAAADHLVKHDNPFVVTQKLKSVPLKKSSAKTPKTEGEDLAFVLKDKREVKNLSVVDVTAAEDILDFILPPRFWLDLGKKFTQKVSRIPATRMDLFNLQEKLDLKLERLKARETGICPLRRELYAQAFDELIRQTTLECAERGLMLLRVRDEIRMTLIAYQTLFESSMAYGMRKVLLSERGKNHSHSQICDLSGKNVELQGLVNQWMAKHHDLEVRNQELRRIDGERKEDELAVVKRTNNQLAAVLNNIIVQRTLVFNVGSDFCDLVPEKDTPPPEPLESEKETYENRNLAD